MTDIKTNPYRVVDNARQAVQDYRDGEPISFAIWYLDGKAHDLASKKMKEYGIVHLDYGHDEGMDYGKDDICHPDFVVTSFTAEDSDKAFQLLTNIDPVREVCLKACMVEL